MNQFRRFLLSGVATLGLLSPLAHGATITIDDFNGYNNATMIQAQNSAWSKFGVAFADGIYSVAGGVGGTRGASVILQFEQASTKTNGSIRYSYGTPASFEQGVTFSFDLAANVISPSTTVTLQISDSTNTTIWEFSAAKSISNTTFENYSFTLDSTTTRRVGGNGTLDSVLHDLKNVTIRFANSGEDVKQTILIDNFKVTYEAIPEPAAAVLVPLAGGALLALRLRTRRATVAKD